MRYNNTTIRQHYEAGTEDGELNCYYKIRSVGQATKHGSRGGNLSHHIRGKWKHIFKRGIHYVDYRGAIWTTFAGTLMALSLVIQEDKKRGEHALRFMKWFVDQIIGPS